MAVWKHGNIINGLQTIIVATLWWRKRFAILGSGSGKAAIVAVWRVATVNGHGECKCGLLERDILFLQTLEDAPEVFIFNLRAVCLVFELCHLVLELLLHQSTEVQRKIVILTSLTLASLLSLNAFCAARFCSFRRSDLLSSLFPSPSPPPDFRPLLPEPDAEAAAALPAPCCFLSSWPDGRSESDAEKKTKGQQGEQRAPRKTNHRRRRRPARHSACRPCAC